MQREKDDLRSSAGFLQRLRRSKAIELRHGDVQHGDVRIQPADRLNGLPAIGHRRDDGEVIREQIRNRVEHSPMVVGDDNRRA